MLVSRWWLLCLLAVVASVSAAPKETELVGEVFDDELDEFYIEEDDLDDTDLDIIADGIAHNIASEEMEFGRGIGSTLGKGLIKGGKKAGKIILKGGKKGLKLLGKGAKKGLKIIGKGAKKGVFVMAKGALKGAKGVVKVAKSTKKFLTKKGTKIWQSLKTHMKGEMGQAAKKLLKAVGKQVLEVGVSFAVEAVAPMVIEYVMQETQDRLCECKDNMCSCCAQPPGFEKGCLVMRVRPKLKFINAAVTYNGKELVRMNITSEEGTKSCKRLEGLARFMTACIDPIGLGETEDGFRGCLNINLEPLKIEREMCVDFTGTFKNGSAKWVPVSELDEVEIEVDG